MEMLCSVPLRGFPELTVLQPCYGSELQSDCRNKNRSASRFNMISSKLYQQNFALKYFLTTMYYLYCKNVKLINLKCDLQVKQLTDEVKM